MDWSGTCGLVVVAPLWEVPRCMPLHGKIGILPSSSSSHLVKLEDLMCFFSVGMARLLGYQDVPNSGIIFRYVYMYVSSIIFWDALYFWKIHTLNIRIRYTRRHFHPFISGHWQDGNSWQSQASENRSTKLQQTSQRAKRAKSYQYRSNMRLKLDLHRWSFNITLDVVERQGFPIGSRQLFRGKLLNFGRVFLYG